jgi:thiamine-phosphate pyrophosphorylase
MAVSGKTFSGAFPMPRILPGETDLYALTDSRLSLGRSVVDVADALLLAGIRIIQYREKQCKSGVMLQECQALRRMTLEAEACFIVNDHADIALLCQADGVHVGQEDIPVPALRALLGPNKIIGLSTHSPAEALAAASAGADYIGVGPLFATRTKEDVCAPVGLEYLDWAVVHSALPFVAIGGIKRRNIGEVVRHGAKCCALVSELVGARDIPVRIAEVRACMKA